MSIDAVRAYFQTLGLAEKIMEFSVSSATVDLAAQALGCTPARIAKTLSFRIENDIILIVCAGDVKIDNHKYKSRFGCKAKMLTAEEALEYTGHAVGGVCPFGLKKQTLRFTSICPCGALLRFFRPAEAQIPQ